MSDMMTENLQSQAHLHCTEHRPSLELRGIRRWG
jgi:hypothetical protein